MTEISVVDAGLIKKFGKGVFQSGDQIVSQVKLVIPWSPALDAILGGGVPQGSVVRLAGKEKSGKTVSALQLAANAQDIDPETFVLMLDIESRLKKRDIEGIHNLDISKERFLKIGSYRNEDTNEGKILSAEDYLEIAEHSLKNVPKCIVIVDSVSQLVTAAELSGDLGKQHRAPGAILMSQFIKRNSGAVSVNKCLLVSIVHMIANTGGGVATLSESGGNKIKFATDVGMRAMHWEPWRIGDAETGTQIGQKIKWKTNATAIVSPGKIAWSYLRYGHGLDEEQELFEMGVACAIIMKSGAWYTHSYMEDHIDVLGVEKWGTDEKKKKGEGEKMCTAQGGEKAARLLKDNPKWKDILCKQVYEMMDIETVSEI